jgi:hypothetical protein
MTDQSGSSPIWQPSRTLGIAGQLTHRPDDGRRSLWAVAVHKLSAAYQLRLDQGWLGTQLRLTF